MKLSGLKATFSLCLIKMFSVTWDPPDNLRNVLISWHWYSACVKSLWLLFEGTIQCLQSGWRAAHVSDKVMFIWEYSRSGPAISLQSLLLLDLEVEVLSWSGIFCDTLSQGQNMWERKLFCIAHKCTILSVILVLILSDWDNYRCMSCFYCTLLINWIITFPL